MKPVVVGDDAAADVRNASAWYEARQPGLGVRFEAAVDASLASIEAHPQTFARLRRSRRQRALLFDFPYVVYFRERPADTLVIAVLHGRQDAGPILRRRPVGDE